jgi:hypothetical protein
MAQDSHILRAIADTDTRIILPKSDIEYPMKAIFNRPVSTSSR